MPVPKPPTQTAPLKTPRISNLEYHFGFRHEAFTAYMRQTRKGKLLEILKWSLPELAQSDHPIVLSAAGSAAMELALYSGRQRNVSHEESFCQRKALLQDAEKYWLQASESFSGLRMKQPSAAERVMRMEQQIKHLLACLPFMEVLSARYARYPLPAEEVEDKKRAANVALSSLADYLIGMPTADEHIRRVRAGLIAEVACSIVGRADEYAGYVFLPASLRQHHHRSPMLRSDFLAFSAQPPHRKTLIQVQASPRGAEEGSENGLSLLVSGSRDLVLGPRWGINRTLQCHIDTVEGGGDPQHESRLAVIGRVMSMRLDAFNDSKGQ